MIPTQGTLFVAPRGPQKATICQSCKRYGVMHERTADPFEDTWRCLACGTSGTRSYSREFGPRREEAKARA